MSKFLANCLEALNSVFAILLIVGGMAAGLQQSELGPAPVGLLLGALFGLGAAIVICGFLALIITIRNELSGLRADIQRSTQDQT